MAEKQRTSFKDVPFTYTHIPKIKITCCTLLEPRLQAPASAGKDRGLCRGAASDSDSLAEVPADSADLSSGSPLSRFLPLLVVLKSKLPVANCLHLDYWHQPLRVKIEASVEGQPQILILSPRSLLILLIFPQALHYQHFYHYSSYYFYGVFEE